MSRFRRKVAVAVSGGVDSSVAALLLRQNSRNEVVGLHMNNWNHDDEDNSPTHECSEKDRNDALAVCQKIDIPFHEASFAAEYWTGVFEPYVSAIQKGQMPNPDINCNSLIKFGAMRDYARGRLGAEFVATGHYARLWDRSISQLPHDAVEGLESKGDVEWLFSWGAKDSPLLLAGADKRKDQSYFLAGVNGESFRNVLFPLGDSHKSGGEKNVRAIAAEAELPTAQKRDSTGICFIGKRRFEDFISQYLPEPPVPGNFVCVDTGGTVGRHNGSMHYTIGQGARIGGSSEKWFVVERPPADLSTVFVCAGTHHPALYSDSLTVENVNWIGGDLPVPLARTGRLQATCRTRHLQPLLACEIRLRDNGKCSVEFERPVRAITPGQMAVFYISDVCLGGGTILERGLSYHERRMDLPQHVHPSGHNDTSRHQVA